MIANYHTHTRWCNHGTGEIEDYIKEAIEKGLDEIAITEHVPLIDNEDPFRMRWEEFHEYNEDFSRVIEKYGDKINIIKGFECEYYPEAMDSYLNFKEKYGYEIFILGQHTCGGNREHDSFFSKGPEVLYMYADEIEKGLETGMFHFLAHPDLILQNYNNGPWDKHAEEALGHIFKTCERLNIPVEINANGLRGRRAYPNKTAFELSKNYDLKYIINSDAHKPETLVDTAITDTYKFAQDLGIEVIEKLSYK